MSTRRQFLIGAGAVVLAGLVDGCAHGSKAAGRAPATAVTAGSAPIARARVVSGRMASTHVRPSVGWAIGWPARPAEGVVYCLHGHGDDHRFAFDQIHLPEVVAAAGVPLVVAAVDGGEDSYWHPRADGTDALAMLLDEFVPMLDRQLPVSTPRALLGWSMGGYGALLAAETAPERFRAVAAASPALCTSPGATAPGAFDGPADYRRFDVFGGSARLTGLTVRVDCGTGDPFYSADRSFVARLPAAEAVFGPGAHDAAYWRRVAPAQIATIATALNLR